MVAAFTYEKEIFAVTARERWSDAPELREAIEATLRLGIEKFPRRLRRDLPRHPLWALLEGSPVEDLDGEQGSAQQPARSGVQNWK
jgi:hypothetical protein